MENTIDFINYSKNIDVIKEAFLNEPARCQAYIIRGASGVGKTALMTALSEEIAKEPDWICIDLNSSSNMLSDLSYHLKKASEQYINVPDKGCNCHGKEHRDSVSLCEEILKNLNYHRKKLLITIDNVYNGQSMKHFVSQFQIWIRNDFPIFLIMTGAHENIYAIQNDPQLTFLLRSPKITLDPIEIS